MIIFSHTHSSSFSSPCPLLLPLFLLSDSTFPSTQLLSFWFWFFILFNTSNTMCYPTTSWEWGLPWSLWNANRSLTCDGIWSSLFPLYSGILSGLSCHYCSKSICARALLCQKTVPLKLYHTWPLPSFQPLFRDIP